jgi:hypothetical protein
MKIYRFVIKHKGIISVIGVILSVFLIYQFGIRIGDFLYKVIH